MAGKDRQDRSRPGKSARPADFFRSVDSAPKGISVKRDRSVTDGFLISFLALTVLALSAAAWANARWPGSVPTDLIFFTADRFNAVLPIRIFLVIFFLVYAAYAHGPILARLRLGFSFLFKLGVIAAIVDGAALLSWQQADAVWPVAVQQILVGLAGLAIFPHTVLNQARLPAPCGSPVRRRGRHYEYWLVSLAALVSAIGAVIALTLYGAEVEQLRNLALLGGMGPGVFLAQQFFTLQLAALGTAGNALSRRRAFSPPVAVLIPAHNESHLIAQTIDAIDEAAAHYDGPVRILLMENCSSDDTAELARQAIAKCRCARGEVIESLIPGKAKALNHGLELITEDYVVRIDADTQIDPKSLRIAMRHFASDTVGIVGGLPLPLKKTGLLDKFRTIEVLNRHGYFQVALGAFNGILGIPGMFCIYRRDVLMEAGGIVEEMNREDTDIVLRMTNLGYRAVSDPRVKFRTEVPDSMDFLREQRTRWFRSLYHVTAHNREMLFQGNLITGAVVLPFTLMNGARRAMMAPLAIYGVVLFFLFGGIYDHPHLTTVLAVMFGMPFIMACAVVAFWRRPDLILYMPAYMAFRLLRSYYTLGATLTLVYPGSAKERRFEPPKPLAMPEGERIERFEKPPIIAE